MVLMHSFCFYFSIRLGTIMVGIFTMCQSLVALIISILWVIAPKEETQETLKEMIEENNLLFVSDLASSISKDPSMYSGITLAFMCFHVASCFAVIYGAYYCHKQWLLPFNLLEGVRLILVTITHITGMMIIKENNQDLGLLIGATLAGSFLLLFLYYCLTCVIALWQCLNQLGERPSLQERDETNGQHDKLYSRQNRSSRANLIDELGRYPRYPNYRAPMYPQPIGYGQLIAPIY